MASGPESARKVLQLLLCFSGERPTATIRELAAAIGVPLPTAYRYVTLLRELGLVEEGPNGSYHVTLRLSPLARAADAAIGLIQVADPIMRRLAADTGETALLVRLIGGAPVVVHRIDGPGPVRISFEPGQVLPRYGGASGRVLLAALPPEERAAAVIRLGGEPVDRGDRAAVERELDAIARRGWATINGEVERGIWGAAAPVTDAGRTIAALSVPAPWNRGDAAVRERTVALVVEAAGEVSSAFGARPRALAD